MPVLTRIGMLYTCAPEGGQGEVHPIPDAALVWEDGVIRWVGPERELPHEFQKWENWDAGGRMVIPGLVDCHTHLAFGGWRADEFEQRILGRSYLEIAEAGGGILSTVAKTRAASESALTDRAAGFLARMAALGITTVEAKSGYGLDIESELRLLRIYRRLGGDGPLRVIPTFLGAHTIPVEYRERREEYVDLLIRRLLPIVATEKLARFCDVFVEKGAFSLGEGRRILLAGRAVGLGPKLHADQLSSGGGAELAAEVAAVSADHLECISEAGIAALARSGTVAVSLPLATAYLNHQPLPARRLIEAGVPVAVATDFNPGSAPSYHLPLAMLLACTIQRMTPAEVLKGATLIAARAIGLEREIGSLEPGKAADFAEIDAASVNHWLYHFTPNACTMTVCGGKRIPLAT
ncbi:MAG TPA: imidazolonepropionase [Gemmatimonadales bacterium]|nr:imidazolonepropionase [Gemmatimonadales bacterium]